MRNATTMGSRIHSGRVRAILRALRKVSCTMGSCISFAKLAKPTKCDSIPLHWRKLLNIPRHRGQYFNTRIRAILGIVKRAPHR
jgi:hypothetical protein